MKQAVLTSKVRGITEILCCLILRVLKKIWGYSSAGRAPALQAGGQRFDPAYLHHGRKSKEPLRLRELSQNQYGLIAQPVRASA